MGLPGCFATIVVVTTCFTLLAVALTIGPLPPTCVVLGGRTNTPSDEADEADTLDSLDAPSGLLAELSPLLLFLLLLLVVVVVVVLLLLYLLLLLLL